MVANSSSPPVFQGHSTKLKEAAPYAEHMSILNGGASYIALLQEQQKNTNNLSTTTPLGSTTCSGLGPARVEDLDIVKADIGLKEPIIIIDYPRQERNKTRYGGSNIPPSEVEQLKAKIRGIQWQVKKNNAGPQGPEWKKGDSSTPCFIMENTKVWRDPPPPQIAPRFTPQPTLWNFHPGILILQVILLL